MTGTEGRLTESVEAPRKRRASRRSRAAAEHRVDETISDELPEEERDEDDFGEIPDEFAERFASFEGSVDREILPQLPSMPGFHVCWLSTTNPSDPVQKRLNWGYELITPAMVKNWRGAESHLSTGEYAGVIGLNEMVAARIPTELYKRFMKKVHHDMPLADEQKLRAHVVSMKEHLASRGSQITEEGDGTANIVQPGARPRPEFPD